MRKFNDSKLLIASHNKGKVREIGELLKPFGLDVISASDLNIEESEETEDTFEGNALLKAVYCTKHSNLPSLADDSGLVVPALGGAPGIYSARWAGPGLSTDQIMNYTLDKLKEIPANRRGASFRTCACVVSPEGDDWFFNGSVKGVILTEPRTKCQPNMPYSAIFLPNGQDRVFAEMSVEEENAISQRGKAFRQVRQWFSLFPK